MILVKLAAIEKNCWKERDLYKENIRNCNHLFCKLKESFMHPMKQRKKAEAIFL